MILLLAVLQTAVPTVGDTIWVEREVRPPVGVIVHAADWAPEGAVTLLGPAQVVTAGDAVMVRYPVVAWEPGRHSIEVPGPILLAPTGVEDTLSPLSRTLAVASVLPSGDPDSLAIQPPAGVVNQDYTTWTPLLSGTLLAIALLAPLHWLWRRRRPARTMVAAPDPDPLDGDMIREWADAGEERTVAHAGYLNLRRAIAGQLPDAAVTVAHAELMSVVARERPEWPAHDLERVLSDLDALRFRQAPGSGALDRYREALELAERLGGHPR